VLLLQEHWTQWNERNIINDNESNNNSDNYNDSDGDNDNYNENDNNDNVQMNTESVQCISIAYSEVRITEISEQLSRVDQGPNLQNFVKCTYETVTKEL